MSIVCIIRHYYWWFAFPIVNDSTTTTTTTTTTRRRRNCSSNYNHNHYYSAADHRYCNRRGWDSPFRSKFPRRRSLLLLFIFFFLWECHCFHIVCHGKIRGVVDGGMLRYCEGKVVESSQINHRLDCYSLVNFPAAFYWGLDPSLIRILHINWYPITISSHYSSLFIGCSLLFSFFVRCFNGFQKMVANGPIDSIYWKKDFIIFNPTWTKLWTHLCPLKRDETRSGHKPIEARWNSWWCKKDPNTITEHDRYEFDDYC